MSEAGIHRPPVAGIAGSSLVGSQSIVLSGGYEDDKVHNHVTLHEKKNVYQRRCTGDTRISRFILSKGKDERNINTCA